MRTPEVWKVDVAAELPRLEAHQRRLDAAELARAARFHRDEDRVRFVVGRSTRRELLAQALGVDAAAIAFECDRHGKPRMPAGTGAGLHFNSSHSGRWVLHAFADVAVGVDVEQVLPEMASLEDFAWILSSDERAFVQSAEAPLRGAALATAWVRKEAYVKALGEGLGRDLGGIGILLEADGRPALAYDRSRASDEPGWSFWDLEIDDAHKACVVQAGPRRGLAVRHYRP